MVADPVLVIEFNDEEVGPLNGTGSPGTISAHSKIGSHHFPSVYEDSLMVQNKIRFPKVQQHLLLARRVSDHEVCFVAVTRNPALNPVFRGGNHDAGREKQKKEEGKEGLHGMILRRSCFARVP